MITIAHEYFVSLEVAKLLKEAGFKWFINTAYRDGVLMRQGNLLCDNFNGKQYENAARHEFFSAPTLDVAQRWLRETQKYQVAVLPNGLKGYAALCFLYKEPITQPFEHYSTYEEALEVGIKRVLEIILEKGE